MGYQFKYRIFCFGEERPNLISLNVYIQNRKNSIILTLLSQRSVIRRFQLHHELSKGIGNPRPEYGQYEYA